MTAEDPYTTSGALRAARELTRTSEAMKRELAEVRKERDRALARLEAKDARDRSALEGPLSAAGALTVISGLTVVGIVWGTLAVVCAFFALSAITTIWIVIAMYRPR